ncbi:MAG: biopolymer transporter ExbD [Acidobacteria bacterium]|nr:biopolymer transporter ExbD [Acidobacteriota bacterium]MCZ6489233.1 biopolymer transporter ExbD [Acidobacteriota bacterium]
MAFTNPQGRTQTSLSDINVTPFVDVLLVLLVIFMLTAPILQSGIELNVPQTRTVQEISQEKLVVSIDREQRLFLGNDPVNINQLGPLLREKAASDKLQSVFLRADKDVPFGTVAMVVDELRLAGIEQISMVTEPQERRR